MSFDDNPLEMVTRLGGKFMLGVILANLAILLAAVGIIGGAVYLFGLLVGWW